MIKDTIEVPAQSKCELPQPLTLPPAQPVQAVDCGDGAMLAIDWSEHDRTHDPGFRCICRCGTQFVSQVRYVGVIGQVTRKPCPKCGQHSNCCSIGGITRETVALSKEDIGAIDLEKVGR